MRAQILKIILLAVIISLFTGNAYSQNPTYTLTVTNAQQVDNKNYEFDIYLLRTGGTAFEYANNSQYFININPTIINGGTISFTILASTCELNIVQQILGSKVSFDAVNTRLRIAAHSPSGAGTGTIISNSVPGTRLGRFRVTNTVTFAAAQTNLTWYDVPIGFYTKVFAYVSALNVEITNPANHLINILNPPLPVIISSFNSTVKKNDVSLAWTTESEINNSGFDVERKTPLNPPEGGTFKWVKIGFIQGNGTTNEPKHYAYEDKKLKAGAYKYRLKQIDYNSNFEYFDLVQDVKVETPGSFSLGQNYPNPSNPKSKIDYEIPINGKVTIKLYNLLGQEVINIVNETKEAGYYTAEFDGSNLASGVYFYRIIAEGEGQSFGKTLKMVLVK